MDILAKNGITFKPYRSAAEVSNDQTEASDHHGGDILMACAGSDTVEAQDGASDFTYCLGCDTAEAGVWKLF